MYPQCRYLGEHQDTRMTLKYNLSLHDLNLVTISGIFSSLLFTSARALHFNLPQAI